MVTSHLPTDITTEWYIRGTGWTSTYGGVALDSRLRSSDRIRISRGTTDQQSAFSPSTAAFTLNNRDGIFSPNNPNSPLFGRFGQNTPVRTGVQTGGTWDEFLRMPDIATFGAGQKASTTDKASLDIVGDIDIRIEFASWYTRGARQSLAGKWDTGSNNRAWFLEMRTDGQMALYTSPDGTFAAAINNVSGVTMTNIDTGRTAVRVTLDVDNGAGGRVYTWYTAPSIAGPWTQVSSGTVAGTTSIFNSTGALEVGSANSASGPFAESSTLRGKVYGFELRSGIAGTLVADFKPAGKGVGTTSWTDTCASPNFWQLTGTNIRIGSDRIRFTGEMSALPETWDETGQDIYIPATAKTLAGRLSSNKSPLGSAMYRNYRNYPLLNGYWPCEDQAGATQAANAVPNGPPGQLAVCTFGAVQGLDGSAGALTLTQAPGVSRAIFRGNTPTTTTGYTNILWCMRLDTLPSTVQPFLTVQASGSATKWIMFIGPTSYSFRALAPDGSIFWDSGTFLFGASPLDQWVGMQIRQSQSGGNVVIETTWHAIGTNTFYTHNPGGTSVAGTVGKGFLQGTFYSADVAFAGAQVAQVIISQNSDLWLNGTRFRDASKGYASETAGRRMQRLCSEEGVTFEWLGDLDSTQPVGPQQPDTLNNLMAAAAAVDTGQLGDGRDFAGYRYASAPYLGNRRGCSLTYSDSTLAATPSPATDDRYTVNDFTASRPSGSSARVVADDGRPKNVNDPDDPDVPGVGRYERTGAFNASTDAQLVLLAGQQVALGTWNEARIPNLALSLHRNEVASRPQLLADIIANDCADQIAMTVGAGKPMAAGSYYMLNLGYTETIMNMTWDIVDNTVPAGPYQVPILGTSDVNGEPRMDADFGGTQVHGAYASGATSIRLRTSRANPCKWVIDSTNYASEFPCDFNLAGERVTLTACTTTSSTADLLNGTFETATGGVTGWDSNVTLSQSTTFAQAGTASALLTVSGSPGALAYLRCFNNMPGVFEGDQLTLFGWVRSVALLSDVRLSIDWYDANKAYMTTSDTTPAALASGSWVSKTLNVTVPDGARFASYGSSIYGSPSVGTLLYTDSMVLTNANWYYQTGTFTRAVNGISKAQVDAEHMQLWQPFNLGLE